MQAINIIEVFEKNVNTKFVLAYWSIGETVENCVEAMNESSKFESVKYSYEMISLIYELLDMQQDLDLEEYID